ncbi:DUF1474 family protein [Streptococcus pneumoniae]|uniref:type II toxin-antitoxin system toxin TscT n=1 Tax=Streptococcus pneumoniae TaxID=1313 RepID=UPI001CB7930E
MEIIKEKINDVMTSFTWFDEEYFIHEPNHVLNKNEILAQWLIDIMNIEYKIVQ